MILHDLGKNSTLLQVFVDELRDISIQKDRMRFRKNMQRIGEIMAYEYSKTASYESVSIETPLAQYQTKAIEQQPIVCSILRAGLALHNGLLSYLDKADSAFVSAYRKMKDNNIDFNIEVEYLSTPEIEHRILFLVDPMLATGNSIWEVYKQLVQYASPAETHLFVVLAAPEGIDFLNKKLPVNTHLWVAKIDQGLNKKYYILPGLGDAGDLAYGVKL